MYDEEGQSVRHGVVCMRLAAARTESKNMHDLHFTTVVTPNSADNFGFMCPKFEMSISKDEG